MKLKTAVRSLALAAVCLLQAGYSLAQAWPSRPIKVIVPFAPGGSADGTLRVVSEKLTEALGQPVVIDNRPGGSATIGAAAVAKAEPDGYTLLLMPGTHVIATKMVPNVPFHPINDFTPVSTLVFAPYVIVGAKTQPFSTLKEMVQAAKARPASLTIGNSDVVTRLGAEMLSQAAGIQLEHVNYKGGGPITTDVLGGHLPLGVATPVAILSFHKDRRLNALAVTSPRRLGTLPDVPTVSEALGVADFDSRTWFALAGPANLPKPVVDRLQRAVKQVMAQAATRERLLAMGLEPADDHSPEAMAQLMRTFGQRNGALIDSAKIKMD